MTHHLTGMETEVFADPPGWLLRAHAKVLGCAPEEVAGILWPCWHRAEPAEQMELPLE